MPIRVFCLPKKSQMYRQGFISILVLFADYVNACSGWIHEKKKAFAKKAQLCGS